METQGKQTSVIAENEGAEIQMHSKRRRFLRAQAERVFIEVIESRVLVRILSSRGSQLNSCLQEDLSVRCLHAQELLTTIELRVI